MKKVSYISGIIFLLIYSHSVKLSAQNSIVLNGAYIVLDGGVAANHINIVIDQPNPLGIVRLPTGGHIHSENQFNIVKWITGSSTGNYVFPFGVDGTASDYIPFTFNKTAGNNSVSLSTWATTIPNSPKPVASNIGPVTNMNGIADSIKYAIDRFWDIQATATTADLTFSYRGIENTTISPTANVYAQHWNGTVWDPQVGPGVPGVTVGIGTSGSVMGQNTFSPWVLTICPPTLGVDVVSICSYDSVFVGGAFQNTAGTYIDTLFNSNYLGCDSIVTTTVIVFDPIVIDNIAITDISCGGTNGEVVVTASGGTGTIKYSSDGGLTTQPSGTFPNLPSGSITISILDDNCQIDSIVSIGDDGTTVPNQPSAIIGDIIVCNGDSKNYSVTSETGVTYTWTYSGSGTISGSGNAISLDNITTAGTLTVTPSNGCGDGTPQTINITVNNVPDQPSVINGNASMTCGTTSGNYSVTDEGVTYTWTYSGNGDITGSGNAISLDNVTTGGTLTITPSNTCGDGIPQIITIDIIDSPSIDNADITQPSCGQADGGIDITVSGGTIPYDFSWSNGATTEDISNVGSGSYTVTVTDDTGCSIDSTFTLNNPSAPTITDIVATQTSCNSDDGTITITASGTGTLQYSIDNGTTFQGSGLFTGLGEGDYDIVVKDANGCEATGTATITRLNAPDLTLVSSDDVTCNGDSDGNIEVIATGGTGAYTYSWTPNVSTTEAATNLPAGNYTITVTDGSGCTEDLQVTIIEPSAITIVETITAADCGQDNGSISLQVTGGDGNYTYTWNPNVGSTDHVTDLAIGTYGVTVTDGNGCSETVSYNVPLGNSFYIEATPANTTILQGGSVTLDLFIDPNITVDTIIWMPAEGLSCTDCKNPIASPNDTTIYIVTVIDDNGCISTDTVIVNVILPCAEIFVPNSFSPNADGLNDLQCVLGECIISLEFTIFSRWGETVFYTMNQKECWDGTFRGELVQSGVYVYKLKATLESGEKVDQSGNITVIR